jgi:hypothetical protein
MNNISDILDTKLNKMEYDACVPLSNEKVSMFFDVICDIDKDMNPILSIIKMFTLSSLDKKYKTFVIKQIIKFYGIGNTDILQTRSRHKLDSGHLVRVPFLKKNQKESINILLKEMGIFDDRNV